RQVDSDGVVVGGRSVEHLGELVDVGQVDVAGRDDDGPLLGLLSGHPELTVGHGCSSLRISTVVPCGVGVIVTVSTRALINLLPCPRCPGAFDAGRCQRPLSLIVNASPVAVARAVTSTSTSRVAPRTACSTALEAASPTASRISPAAAALTAAVGSQ